jgi:glycosyltransferase involved in cell wall biosynthesis
MRVFFLIPDLGFGGAQRQLIELIRQFAKDPSISIILCTIVNNCQLLDTLDEQVRSRIKLYCLNKQQGKWYNIPAFFSLIKYIGETNPHIVHAFLGRGMSFAMLAKLFQTKPKLIIGFRNALYLRKRWLSLEKLNFQRIFKNTVNINTCNSREALANSQEYFGYSENISYFFPNGVNTEIFFPSPNYSPSRKICFLIPARIIAQKNQLSVVQAVLRILQEKKEVPEFEILLVGENTSKGYGEQLHQFISENNLQEYIQIYPPTKDIQKYYKMADIVLLPSHHEGFPNVLLEAWACAKPVLISKEADTANIVADSQGGWTFAAADVDEFIVEFFTILNLPHEEIKRQGEIGYRIVQADYSIKKVADNYLNLYNNLVKRCSDDC